MKLNSKGQVTLPSSLRKKHRLHEGDEVDVIEDGDTLRIVPAENAPTRGQRLVQRMRGSGTAKDTEDMTTDELMAMLRDD